MGAQVPSLRSATVVRIAKVMGMKDLRGIPCDLPECAGSQALCHALMAEYLRSNVHAAPMRTVRVEGTFSDCTKSGDMLISPLA